MWVSYEKDNVWVCYLGSVGLILFLYCVKAVVLWWVRSPTFALAGFAVAGAFCFPLTWALSPDWNNRQVHPAAILGGSPIATLFVPYVSFRIDLARRSSGKDGGWYWRVPLELLVGVPAWFVFWVYFEVFVLGWAWI